jgi:DNA-binding HxlR family transcriptional regulator
MKKDKEKKKKREKRGQQEERFEEKTPGLSLPDGSTAEPLQYALAEVGGKWKLRILWALRDGDSLRYGDIKKQISAITDMMLSQSLRELTASGLVLRQQYQQIPPKVEYRMTPAGAELVPAMELLCAWGLKHFNKEEK